MHKIVFNEVSADDVDLLVIAGEYSGDEHAAVFIRELKSEYPLCNIFAIGGENLEKTGVKFLFNLVEFSVVGIVEVLKNIKIFSRLVRLTCDWIDKNRPRCVCFVDFPGFNLHVAKELFRRGISSKAGGNVKVYHYISPQIWAWRSKRRFKIAKYVDSLGAIFPFEKEHYSDTNLDVQFLGHPFLNENYIFPIKYDANGPILLLPGSRVNAVKKIFPIMLNSVNKLKKIGKNRELAVIYPDDDILLILQKISEKYKNLSISFVRSGSRNISASASLMSSGTMALNCALAGIPGVVVYKSSTVTYGLGKLLLKVKFLHMSNILLKKESAREFLQFSAKPKLICQALCDCLDNNTVVEQFKNDADELKKILSAKPENNVFSWIKNALL